MFSGTNFYIRLEVGGTGAVVLALLAGVGLLWCVWRLRARARQRHQSGKRVCSTSRYLGRVGSGAQSPGYLVPALPFMIVHDLVSGNRVAALKEQLGKPGRGMAPNQWSEQKFNPGRIYADITGKSSHKSYAKLMDAVSHPSKEYVAKYGEKNFTVDDEIEAREQAFEQTVAEYTDAANAAKSGETASDGEE